MYVNIKNNSYSEVRNNFGVPGLSRYSFFTRINHFYETISLGGIKTI